jgi:hypothetical protein
MLREWGYLPEDFDEQEEEQRIEAEQRSNPAFRSLAQNLNPEE